jgi:pyruvate formate lyase activating enzyme
MNSYARSVDSVVVCTLCPHGCRIPEGSAGKCLVRQNRGGRLSLPFRGVLSSVAIDPIEKKPLYHFHPGREIFSVGFFGCNFRCPFCQNYTISQHTVASAERITPSKLVSRAVDSGSFAIAYTYSEPLVHFEFVRDTCIEARKKGLANVLVTNGYLSSEPTRELARLIDAANVDLKGWNDRFYRDEIGGSLAPVKAFIERLFEAGVHVEITTLVIPGKNDTDEEIDGIASFIASLSVDIPYHLSAYYPAFRYTVPPTRADRVVELVALARRRLRYVYAGNLRGVDSDTACPGCGATLIARRGYRVEVTGVHDGACSRCGFRIAFPGL